VKGGIIMDKKERETGHFFAGLLIGGVLGGVASLMFAPKSGRELRADIRRTGEKGVEETKAFMKKASHEVSEASQRAKSILSCMKEKGEAAPRYRTESAEESVGEA
jgi:gas vesicle protein